MLPNVVAAYRIILAAFLGHGILLEASLSFLSGTTAAWGLMLRGAAVDFAERAPWMALVPALAISLAVFAFNVVTLWLKVASALSLDKLRAREFCNACYQI